MQNKTNKTLNLTNSNLKIKIKKTSNLKNRIRKSIRYYLNLSLIKL